MATCRLMGVVGEADIRGCTIQSLGRGLATGVSVIKAKAASINAGGTGYGSSSGTLTWNNPGDCITNPVLNVTATGGVITSISVVTVGNCQHYLGTQVRWSWDNVVYTGSTTSAQWTVGGGLSAGAGAIIYLDTWLQSSGAVATGVGMSGPNDPAFTYPSGCCFPGDGDGILMISTWAANSNHSLIVDPGTYVATGGSDPTHGKLTLSSPIHTFDQFGGGNFYDLPASQKYTVQTTIGSNSIIVTAGPRPLQAGDMIWSDAFLFGATVWQGGNAIVGTPTVRTGGTGYVGTTGTMTWSGPICGTYPDAAPVLNVTAAGGVVTGVTSVANAGNCLRGTPSSSATTWTPGGGLSGGSGASFNMTWQQTATINNITLTSSASAHVTHTSGSPGQMWVIPAGVKRRVQGFLTDNYISFWPFGLMAECSSGTWPTTGCNDSYDKGNSFLQNLVGRIVVGNNTGASTSVANVYAHIIISQTFRKAAPLAACYVCRITPIARRMARLSLR